jgi:hypothetical protein
MTSSIILAMAQKRSRCESRTIHNLRRSRHRTDCIAAVDQRQREVMVANHKRSWGKLGYVKEVKWQYYDLNMAFGLKKGHIKEATLSLQQACVCAGMSSKKEELKNRELAPHVAYPGAIRAAKSVM